MGFRRGDPDSITLTTATSSSHDNQSNNQSSIYRPLRQPNYRREYNSTSRARPLTSTQPPRRSVDVLSEENVRLLQRQLNERGDFADPRDGAMHNYENSTNVFAPVRQPHNFNYNNNPDNHYQGQSTAPPPNLVTTPDPADFDEKQVRAYSKKVPENKSGNANPIIRYSLLACAIVFQIAGAGVLCLGVWLKVDNRLRALLSERYQQTVNNSQWSAATVYALVYVIIALACLLIINGCLGCCAIVSKRLWRCLIATYLIFNVIVFFAILATGLYVLVRKQAIQNEIGDALNYMVQHYYQGQGVIQQALDAIQISFHCCGNSGCSDFRQLRQDLPRSCDIDCEGCRYRVYQGLQGGATVLMVVFAVVLLCQMLTCILCCLYCVSMSRNKFTYSKNEQLRMRTINNTLVNSAYRSEDIQNVVHSRNQSPSTTLNHYHDDPVIATAETAPNNIAWRGGDAQQAQQQQPQDVAREQLRQRLAEQTANPQPTGGTSNGGPPDRQSYVNAYTQQPVTYRKF